MQNAPILNDSIADIHLAIHVPIPISSLLLLYISGTHRSNIMKSLS